MSTIFRVERTGNFTVMSNMHLKDRRLSFKSKGLLSVIFSLPPDWKYTLTGFAKIAADGVESVKSTVKELEKYGYVSRRQTRDERGRMSVNEYLVYENPQENPDYVPDEDFADAFVGGASVEENIVEAVEKSVENPKNSSSEKAKSTVFSSKPSAGKPLSENPSAVNHGAVSINKLNKNLFITEKSINSFTSAQARKRTGMNEGISEKQHICSLDEWRRCYDVISGNIEYDTFYAKDIGVREQVDEFIKIMTDVVCSNSPTVRVNGEAMSRELVSARFMDFTSEDIDCVLDSLKNKSSATANTRNYLITVLYNAYATKANKYSIMAYNDIREGVI